MSRPNRRTSRRTRPRWSGCAKRCSSSSRSLPTYPISSLRCPGYVEPTPRPACVIRSPCCTNSHDNKHTGVGCLSVYYLSPSPFLAGVSKHKRRLRLASPSSALLGPASAPCCCAGAAGQVEFRSPGRDGPTGRGRGQRKMASDVVARLLPLTPWPSLVRRCIMVRRVSARYA